MTVRRGKLKVTDCGLVTSIANDHHLDSGKVVRLVWNTLPLDITSSLLLFAFKQRRWRG